ncbi:BirA family biotin operon repressor/biotin-[acetyl-CoA-carboxylase] ligase [Dysgonomonas sp. PH5-45]|uniref:biotin--[acetyl-CoA-carboxylase] ligase n=1 Tax=unclassified Dysgonomonas TaxID=2630389 RepID=UPI002475BD57|nr:MULTISPECIES: biotin--[acetyl-CoA-carboxylase] ligase [unclassified Dysgonomonas]MDH6354887.1 BirA family biotin operon repressor/biotin-[acetyl-CoA-carboxylase] ligase [Dysgonomonas sp. PH5-45]MDH6387786.1 BirA family biotin operon repressor/biotin-[acetyl-CoA-carboxylase] ligase [Dysgonomonas sp. PH5-37]
MKTNHFLPILHLDETDSTNNYLSRLIAEKTVEEGTAVSAEIQTAGRGQRGNTWIAQRGKNLLFSMVLYPHFVPVAKQFVISQCAALAVSDILAEYTPDIKIKWPNDIYWRNQKICGMLIENNLQTDSINHSIIGIGINVNQADFDESVATRPTSLFRILGKEQNRTEILRKVVSRLLQYYEDVRMGKDTDIAEKYKRDLFTTGIFKDTTGVFEAVIKDVAPTGILTLTDNEGNDRQYAFKEVEYVIQ